jgi:hypothetical protein
MEGTCPLEKRKLWVDMFQWWRGAVDFVSLGFGD